MHAAARNFFEKIASSVPEDVHIVEFGSLDINGGVKDLFSPASYLGVDIAPGPGVDVVCDASEWNAEIEYDLVLCAEVFEHTERWPEVCHNAYRSLRSGGRFIGSCASTGRKPHSAIDGADVRFFEHYENVTKEQMYDVLKEQNWTDIYIEYNSQDGDLYFTAVKP